MLIKGFLRGALNRPKSAYSFFSSNLQMFSFKQIRIYSYIWKRSAWPTLLLTYIEFLDIGPGSFIIFFSFPTRKPSLVGGSRGEAGCQLNRDRLWNAAWPYPPQKCRQICLEMSSTITLKFCPKSNAKTNPMLHFRLSWIFAKEMSPSFFLHSFFV